MIRIRFVAPARKRLNPDIPHILLAELRGEQQAVKRHSRTKDAEIRDEIRATGVHTVVNESFRVRHIIRANYRREQQLVLIDLCFLVAYAGGTLQSSFDIARHRQHHQTTRPMLVRSIELSSA